ncbi:hypothetical protein V6N13_095215 [Hibiscus sabdariffa]|uniref:Uncharacterized protein n=1 Tax=Hibiscus sabdariffa TaxID=183260 RepID=A0ABR2PSE0_9ROSI
MAADEDPKNICPGGAVMAQEMLVDNLVVSIGSKEVEREELSGRISPVLEHRKMDHVTLELPEFQSITKPGRVKRYGSLQHLQYNSLSAAEKKKVDQIRKRNKKSLKSPVHSELEDRSLSDSDLKIRWENGIREAKETIAVGRKVGMEFIGDEREIIHELVNLELGNHSKTY